MKLRLSFAIAAAPALCASAAAADSWLAYVDDEGCGSSQLWTGRGGYCTGSPLASGTVSVGTPPALPIAKAPSNQLRLGKLKLNEKKGTATLQVKLPSPGRLVLSGKEVWSVKRGGGPGTVALAIRPKAKTAKLLREKGEAKVKVTFTPAGGSARSASSSLTLVRSGG